MSASGECCQVDRFAHPKTDIILQGVPEASARASHVPLLWPVFGIPLPAGLSLFPKIVDETCCSPVFLDLAGSLPGRAECLGDLCVALPNPSVTQRHHHDCCNRPSGSVQTQGGRGHASSAVQADTGSSGRLPLNRRPPARYERRQLSHFGGTERVLI